MTGAHSHSESTGINGLQHPLKSEAHTDIHTHAQAASSQLEVDSEVLEWISNSPVPSAFHSLLKEKFASHFILDLATLRCVDSTSLAELEIPIGIRAPITQYLLKWKREVQKKESTKELTPSSKSQPNAPVYFTAKEITVETECGTDTRVIISVVRSELKEALKLYLKSSVLYDETPEISAVELLQHLPTFKTSGSPPLVALAQFLEAQFKELTVKVDKMIQEGIIEYSCLWYAFQKGTKVYTWEGGQIIGSAITVSKYVRSCWFPNFRIEGDVIKTDGSKFFMTKEHWTIPAFNGTIKLTELPVRLMTPEIEQTLTKRGQMFRQVALGHHYMSYSGSILWKTWCGMNHIKAAGRVMIDGVSFSRLNPNYSTFNSSSRTNDTDMEGLSDDNLFATYPTVPGFSFSAKKWGEVVVDDLSEVVYDDGAYEKLVLPTEKKSLIKALVLNNSERNFSDIITGKGSGCIFLLHGSPGVGKTLTAEAIAELLHKPLYSVSVGELGTNTSELETKLREILEVAGTWKAVILIDEADIFLEKRTENDIVRNAMVGIFLRLLEYHQGVLFLTTNRVKSFDSAFHSRISVALKYEDLDSEARGQIWKNFLSAAHIPFDTESDNGLEISKLAEYELNGRQIRTTVRLAQALAEQEGVAVGGQHVDVTVKIARQFQTDLLSK